MATPYAPRHDNRVAGVAAFARSGEMMNVPRGLDAEKGGASNTTIQTEPTDDDHPRCVRYHTKHDIYQL